MSVQVHTFSNAFHVHNGLKKIFYTHWFSISVENTLLGNCKKTTP
jgi:hypothetical protein